MDPLTAFGLASNVVSFVSFASELFKASREVYSSASGSTENAVLLESVYSNLSSLSTKLQSTCEFRLSDGDFRGSLQDVVKDAAVAVKRLAESCKRDCDELLVVTESLRLKDSNGTRRKWESFRIALRKVWEQKRIDEIEDRLLKTQVGLTLHIGTISGSVAKRHHEVYAGLQARSFELQLDQRKGLQEVKRSLLSLDHIVHASLANNSKPIDKGDVQSLDQKFTQLSLAQDFLEKEQRFLSTLQFEAQPLRHEAISAAHENTFRWLLDDDLGQDCGLTTAKSEDTIQDKTTLAQWLESNNGIFWVTGKPGCGKSTLMKFVAGAKRTHTILSRWASPVVVAAHYFWHSGSPVQRSQEGLLKTLLYDIFRQYPALMQVVCKEQWRHLDNSNEPRRFWSLSSLSEALRKISENSTEIELSFCFFIDGLDEFEGDHDGHFELCRTMCKLSQSPNIKICLSSRPWNVFEEAFGGHPKINVPDLTRNDIRNYSASRLQEHPRWPAITELLDGEWLIDEISNRSSGVFLWVCLVTKVLREGMTNRDRLPDLRRRLDSFPCELEEFFKQILNSVETIYHPKTATILQIALAAKEPLDMVIYDFHDLEHDNEDYFIYSPRSPFTKEDESEIYGRMVCHLNSRTGGLLEISSPSAPVTFLHRTVKDYLTTGPLMDFLQKNTPKQRGSEFIPELSILRGYAAWIKRCGMHTAPQSNDSPSRIEQGISELTKKLMPYAAQLDGKKHLDSVLAKVLDDIDSNVFLTMSISDRTSSDFTYYLARNTTFFRAHLAKGSVKRYVLAKNVKGHVSELNSLLLEESLKDAKSSHQITQARLFNGSGTVIPRSSRAKRRKPKLGGRTGEKMSCEKMRMENSSERDTQGTPAKRRRQV